MASTSNSLAVYNRNQLRSQPDVIIQKASYTPAQKRTALRSVILADEQLVPKLKAIKISVEKKSFWTNMFQTGGLIGSGVGAAVTFGIGATVIGGPLIAVGGGIGLISKYAWGKMEMKAKEDITRTIKVREQVVGRHMEAVKSLKAIIMHLEDVRNLNKHEARRWVLGFVQIYPRILEQDDVKEFIQIIDYCLDEYGRDMSFQVFKIIYGTIYHCLSKEGAKLAFNTFKNISLSAAKMGAPVVFAIDLYFIIGDWVNDPDVVKSLKEYIAHLEYEIEHLKIELENVSDDDY